MKVNLDILHFRYCSNRAGSHNIQPKFSREPRSWRIPLCESHIPVCTEVYTTPTSLPPCNIASEVGNSMGEGVSNKVDVTVRC